MKNSKTISIVLCAVMLFALLASCGGGKVRDDVAVSEIGSSIDTAIGSNGDLVSAPESYITGTMKLDVSAYPEYNIKINSRGVNIDEYGVFKASDSKQAAELETALKDYLQFRIDTWMVEYMPEEFPKLENSEVKVVGNYVMFAILSEQNKKSAFSALESSLAA